MVKYWQFPMVLLPGILWRSQEWRSKPPCAFCQAMILYSFLSEGDCVGFLHIVKKSLASPWVGGMSDLQIKGAHLKVFEFTIAVE